MARPETNMHRPHSAEMSAARKGSRSLAVMRLDAEPLSRLSQEFANMIDSVITNDGIGVMRVEKADEAVTRVFVISQERMKNFQLVLDYALASVAPQPQPQP